MVHSPNKMYFQPTRFVAMRIAINLALFEHLSADEGAPKTKDQLASKAGADSNLIGITLVRICSWFKLTMERPYSEASRLNARY